MKVFLLYSKFYVGDILFFVSALFTSYCYCRCTIFSSFLFSSHWFIDRLINWFIRSLLDWSIDQSIDRSIDWSIDSFIHSFIYLFMDSFIDSFILWLIDWLIDWPIDWLIHSLIYWFIDLFIDLFFLFYIPPKFVPAFLLWKEAQSTWNFYTVCRIALTRVPTAASLQCDRQTNFFISTMQTRFLCVGNCRIVYIYYRKTIRRLETWNVAAEPFSVN